MSKIQWTEETWNPTAGCSIISPGCTNCYAMFQAESLAHRFRSGKYSGLTKVVNGHPVWTGEIRLDEEALLKPLQRKKKKMYFVNSMSDLFHEDLADEQIDRVFAVMERCPQHTFQVLTKRAERMRDYIAQMTRQEWWKARLYEDGKRPALYPDWPLSNVHLGVSCERQQEANARIPLLLRTPAAVRFISAEPLLGPLDLTRIEGLDWVIVGGESGQYARRCDLDWVRDIVRQCQYTGTPVFVKQLGSNSVCLRTDTCGFPPLPIHDKKGGNFEEFPPDLKVREWPTKLTSARVKTAML